jgi:hypothetical protein
MCKRLIWIGCFVCFLAAVFYAGFTFFYTRMERAQAEAADASRRLINKPLPQAQLLDTYGAKVDEQILRKGRVVLIFLTPDCQACLVESEFLRTVISRRGDVTFYGLVAFGKRMDSPQAAGKIFPFKVFYDDGDTLVFSMGINRVPVKIFLENGIIKKGWIGAATNDQAKASFTAWLDELP